MLAECVGADDGNVQVEQAAGLSCGERDQFTPCFIRKEWGAVCRPAAGRGRGGRLAPLDDGASRVVSLRIVVSFLVSSTCVRHRSQSISRNVSPLVRTLTAYRER